MRFSVECLTFLGFGNFTFAALNDVVGSRIFDTVMIGDGLVRFTALPHLPRLKPAFTPYRFYFNKFHIYSIAYTTRAWFALPRGLFHQDNFCSPIFRWLLLPIILDNEECYLFLFSFLEVGVPKGALSLSPTPNGLLKKAPHKQQERKVYILDSYILATLGMVAKRPKPNYLTDCIFFYFIQYLSGLMIKTKCLHSFFPTP
mgnify:CR=1 FL=1